ncbi:MAG: DUF2950 domain-containing protein [Rhodospirillaceae bacterium]
MTGRILPRRIRGGLAALALALPIAMGASPAAAAQRTFATPEAAVDALLAALDRDDEAALVAIFGDDYRHLVITGDHANDVAERANAARALAAFRVLDEADPDRRTLIMGPHAWPVPFPLVRQGGGWRFATEEGVEELLNRRIGANERNAILVLQAYLDAQRQYAARDRDGDGVLQFAQRIASSPGKRDGLYWEAAPDDAEASPFGPLIARSAAYLAGRKSGEPYRGYHFRIVTRQGKGAAGGAYDYVINGRLIAGFAMIAYPDAYGESGVMTFIVNHNGRIFERDLGPETEKAAAGITSFNPAKGWQEVAP